MYKVLAVVKVNNDEALVLDKLPEVKYEKHGEYLLFGSDEENIFLGCYKWDWSSKSWKAFGGSKFDIHMKDGSTIKASGQWWDDGWSEYSEFLGQKVISVALNSIDQLKNCYVFCGGCSMTKDSFNKLRNTYTGKVYEYREYEELLKKNNIKEVN